MFSRISRKKHAKIGILDVPVETEDLYLNKNPNFVGDNPIHHLKIQNSHTKKSSPKKNSKSKDIENWDEKLQYYHFGEHNRLGKNKKAKDHADTIVRANNLFGISNKQQPGDTKYRRDYGRSKGGRRRRKTAKRSRR